MGNRKTSACINYRHSCWHKITREY